MKEYYVYMHTFPNGKVYIGITCQKPNQRWKNGSGYLRKNEYEKYEQPFIANAIIKYGWENIKHEVLFSGLSKAEAEAKEQELILEYKSDKKEYGYNIQHGGNTHKQAETTKQKLRELRTGQPANNRKRVMCLETNVIYDSYKEAAKENNTTTQSISKACSGKLQKAGGLHWKCVEAA